MTTKDLLALLVVVSIWGFNFVPSEIALREFTPNQLGAARFLLVAFPAVFFIARPQIPIQWLVVYGLTQGVGQFSLLFVALKFGMTASLASVLMQCQIFFTALIAFLWLKETLSKALMVGMVVAALGLGCFAVSVLGSGKPQDVTITGLLLTLAASSAWAASNIVVRQVQASGKTYSPLSLLVWGSLVSAVVFVGLVGMDQPESRWQWLDASVLAWVCVLYLAVLSTGVAYGLWTLLLTKYQASQVAPFSLGVPVVGLVSGIVFLGEQVTWLQWLGSCLLMSALVFVVFSGRKRSQKAVLPATAIAEANASRD
jgi:O-acetylserine/cysteine efflux transporter